MASYYAAPLLLKSATSEWRPLLLGRSVAVSMLCDMGEMSDRLVTMHVFNRKFFREPGNCPFFDEKRHPEKTPFIALQPNKNSVHQRCERKDC